MQNKKYSTTKKAYIFFIRNNIEVTKNYLNIICSALNIAGYECEFVTSLKGISRKALIVHAVGLDAIKCYIKGYHRIFIWQQGANGEESYMRNNSNIRRLILDKIDCFVMKKAKLIFFVSEYMRKYYEELFNTKFCDKSYVMPCFNENFELKKIEKKDYRKKNFVYVGSLDLWQCFDETVKLYAEIEKVIPDTFFKVLTFNTEKAERILQDNNIKNYSVNCVPKEQVKEELYDCTYGFVIRRDVEVNRVATPTKISSYLSSGVLPIYSTCLKDFHKEANGKSFAFSYDISDDAEHLISCIGNEINAEKVMSEIEELFNTYYSEELHIKQISDLINKCLS